MVVWGILKAKHQDIQALRRMISQADLALGTNPDPNHPSIKREHEFLRAAVLTASRSCRSTCWRDGPTKLIY